MIYLWFTYELLMIYLYYLWSLCQKSLSHLWFLLCNEKTVISFFYKLLACGPLESSTVDVPPSIAVTSAPLGVADCARKVGFLVAHGERDGASVADRHKSQSPQDWSNGHNIQNLRLHSAFVNNFRFAFIQPICHYSKLSTISDIST